MLNQRFGQFSFDHFIPEIPFAVIESVSTVRIFYNPEFVAVLLAGGAYGTFVYDIGVAGLAVCHRNWIFSKTENPVIYFMLLNTHPYCFHERIAFSRSRFGLNGKPVLVTEGV